MEYNNSAAKYGNFSVEYNNSAAEYSNFFVEYPYFPKMYSVFRAFGDELEAALVVKPFRILNSGQPRLNKGSESQFLTGQSQ